MLKMEITKEISGLIEKRIAFIKDSKKLESYQEKVNFFTKIKTLSERTKQRFLQWIQQENIEAKIKQVDKTFSFLQSSGLPEIMRQKQMRDIGMTKLVLDHFRREELTIGWYLQVLEKRKFTQLSEVKLKQIMEMINNEKLFLGEVGYRNPLKFSDFVSNFNAYKHYFEEGYYFAHVTKSSRFKKILRDGALLSWESYEMQLKKPISLFASTEMQDNTISCICFDVNNLSHLSYGEAIIIFPLYSFRRYNLAIHSTIREGLAVDVYPERDLVVRAIYPSIYAVRNFLATIKNKETEHIKWYQQQLDGFKKDLEENRVGWFDHIRKNFNKYLEEKSMKSLIDTLIKELFEETNLHSINPYHLFFDSETALKLVSYLYFKEKKTCSLEDIYRVYLLFWNKALEYCLEKDLTRLIIPIEGSLVFIVGQGKAIDLKYFTLKYGINLNLFYLDTEEEHQLEKNLRNICEQYGIRLKEIKPRSEFRIDTRSGEVIYL